MGSSIPFSVIVLLALVPDSLQHGRLLMPPSRASAWRYGYDVPVNIDDNELNCGGYSHQWITHDGKCGECGDPWDGPRDHQVGGPYATGTITGTYNTGQTIDVLVQITAQHYGWYEFRLCAVNDKDVTVTWECLNQNKLHFADGTTRYYIPDGVGVANTSLSLEIPTGMTCSQCVLQWMWHCGNSWNTFPNGTACTGCGPQEQFYGCADITILGNGETVPTTASTIPTSTESTTTTTTSTTATTTTTTTTAPGSTTSSSTGGDCVWVGGSDGDDEWCQESCNHVPPHCPSDKCDCDGALHLG